MSMLASDPVIKAYLYMIDKTQADLMLPEYSEIYLRLALKEIYGTNFILPPGVLELGRKLLVLYYCDEYPLLTPVITIMEKCFSREEIYDVIVEKMHVLKDWLNFKAAKINHEKN